MDTWVLLPFVYSKNAAMSMGIQISFQDLFSVIWGIYSKIELLDDVVLPFSIYFGALMLLSVYTLINSVQVSFFFPNPYQTCFLLSFLMIIILTGVTRYLIVILICILLLSETVYFFIYLLAICVCSFKNCLFRSFFHFKIRFFFSIGLYDPLIYFRSWYFIRYIVWNYSLLFHKLPFHFVSFSLCCAETC